MQVVLQSRYVTRLAPKCLSRFGLSGWAGLDLPVGILDSAREGHITGIHVNPPVCSLIQFLNFELSFLVQRISQMGAPDNRYIISTCRAAPWGGTGIVTIGVGFPFPVIFSICIKELVHQTIRWPCV